MRRRDFITALAGATAWMSAAHAQNPRRVIGFLSAFESSDEIPGAGGLASLYQGLKETGFIEGKNISVESRWADGHYDRLPSLAAELVAHKVSVIVADSVPSAFAANAATKTIPIVFMSGADPVKLGLVESLSRPNSNLTGVSGFLSVLGPMWSFCMSCSRLLTRSHCSGILVTRTSKLICRTSGPQPMFSSYAWK